MSSPRPMRVRALTLVALAAICAVGLIAMPGVASAAVGTCVVHDNEGAPLTNDNSITVVAGSSTELTIDCQGTAVVTDYTIDNTSSTGYFDDTAIGSTGTSGPGTSVDDQPNAGTEMIGNFIASTLPNGQYPDSFVFTADNGAVDTFAPVTVHVLVNPAPPVCTIAAGQDGQSVSENGIATPVDFTCTDNGDGPITLTAGGAGNFGSSSLDPNGHALDYTPNAGEAGTDTVDLFAQTANSTFADTTFTYTVTDAAPVCSPLNLTLAGGQDAQLTDVDYTSSCTDADGDALTYGAIDSSGANGDLSTGNHAIYDEASSDADRSTAFTDTFVVAVSDGNPSDDTTVTVHIHVTPDTAPTCTIAPANDNQSVQHDEQTILIPISCSDAEGDSFFVSIDGRTDHDPGFAQVDDDTNPTTIDYESNEAGLGPDTLDVHVTSNRDSLESDLLVHVTVTDAAPVCADAALSMTNDSADGADLACADADDTSLSYEVSQAPLNGTIFQSGSFFTYVPNDGFVGTDTFTVTADDGAIQTPITVTAHVAAAPPIVDDPVVAPILVPVVVPAAPVVPVVTPPVAPLVVIVAPPAPKLSSPVTVKDGKVALALGCANTTTSCKASVALTTMIAGKSLSLGQKAITIKPGKNGAISIVLSSSAKNALKAFAGKTITVKVAVKTTNPKTGKTVTVTKAMKVKVPR